MDDLYELLDLAFQKRKDLSPTAGVQEPNVVPWITFRVGAKKDADEIVSVLQIVDPNVAQVTLFQIHR